MIIVELDKYFFNLVGIFLELNRYCLDISLKLGVCTLLYKIGVIVALIESLLFFVLCFVDNSGSCKKIL